MTVFFKNHQWQVTNNGLETVAELVDSYIPHNRLLNLRTAGPEFVVRVAAPHGRKDLARLRRV